DGRPHVCASDLPPRAGGTLQGTGLRRCAADPLPLFPVGVPSEPTDPPLRNSAYASGRAGVGSAAHGAIQRVRFGPALSPTGFRRPPARWTVGARLLVPVMAFPGFGCWSRF